MSGTSPTERKLTYEDYCLIPDDGMRHEILDGEHIVSPTPLDRHQRVSGNLSRLLANYLHETGLGELRAAPYDVRLAEFSVVQPDLSVILLASMGRLDRRGFEGPPDIVVEILSESNRSHDLVRKRRLYAKEGVPEFWVVDPEVERVDVYRRVQGCADFDRTEVLYGDRGDVLVSGLLPGLGLAVAELFAPSLAAQRLAEAEET